MQNFTQREVYRAPFLPSSVILSVSEGSRYRSIVSHLSINTCRQEGASSVQNSPLILELFKEPHDEAVHKNSYKSRLCELISASLGTDIFLFPSIPFIIEKM